MPPNTQYEAFAVLSPLKVECTVTGHPREAGPLVLVHRVQVRVQVDQRHRTPSEVSGSSTSKQNYDTKTWHLAYK